MDLSWSGATSTSVDIYRNGARIVTTANDGFYTDRIGGHGPWHLHVSECAKQALKPVQISDGDVLSVIVTQPFQPAGPCSNRRSLRGSPSALRTAHTTAAARVSRGGAFGVHAL